VKCLGQNPFWVKTQPLITFGGAPICRPAGMSLYGKKFSDKTGDLPTIICQKIRSAVFLYTSVMVWKKHAVRTVWKMLVNANYSFTHLCQIN